MSSGGPASGVSVANSGQAAASGGGTSSSGSGFGLEEIGIPGRDFLREALTSCTDPLKAIEDFQLDNGKT